MLYGILALSLVSLLLLATTFWLLKSNQSSSQLLQKQLLNQNQNLMDRLMSQDLQTYSVMTALKSSETLDSTSDPLPQDDASIVARMSGMDGYGAELYDEASEFQDMLSEIGLHVDVDNNREN